MKEREALSISGWPMLVIDIALFVAAGWAVIAATVDRDVQVSELPQRGDVAQTVVRYGGPGEIV